MNQAKLMISDSRQMHALLEDNPDSTFLILAFDRDIVDKSLIGDALDRLMCLSDTTENTLNFCSKIAICFTGYDSDPREVWQIPECKKFIRKLNQEWPYFFHFLEKKYDSIYTFFSLMCDLEPIQLPNRVGAIFKSEEQIYSTINAQIVGLDALHKSHKIPEYVHTKLDFELSGVLNSIFKN